MKTSVGFWKLTALVVVLLVLGNGFSAVADGPVLIMPVEPIPWDPDAQPVPSFIGHEATSNPVTALPIPQNPFLSPNPYNTIHKDTYASDTYPNPGPLGHNPIVTTNYLGKNAENNFAEPGPIYMFTDGLLVTWVVQTVGGMTWLQLQLIDPVDLSVLATYDLPGEPSRGLMSLPAGAYMYIDNKDRVLMGTPDRTVWMVSHKCKGSKSCSFTPLFRDSNPPDADYHQKYTYDLRGAIPIQGDAIMALHPDFSGRLWFISYLGVVGALDMDTGVVLGTVNLAPETMNNGIASDETGGVFFNTDRAMYRFDLGQDGKPVQTWREAYDYGTHVKVYSFGSGTTPSLMGTDLVNMTDNADPQMHVNVYRRAKDVEGDRLICSVPVFMPGQSATEDSLISTDQSMVVQNNYGYALPRDVDNGRTTKPGFVRIDIDEDRNGCHIVWTNMEVSEPIMAPELSLETGLIYAYTKPKGPANTDAWYFTAIDFQTGEVVYQVLAGTGGLYNAHCTILTLGPDGAAYFGVWGGLVKLKDGP